MRRRLRSATAAAAIGAAVLLSAVPAAATGSAAAVHPTVAGTTTTVTGTQYGVTNPRVVVHFNFAAGQTAESVAVEPGRGRHIDG